MTQRIAFIGAGQMARHHLAAINGVETPTIVVGVYDGAPERAKEFATLARTHAYPSVYALLRGARPDIVHVCTPPGAHFAAAYAALEAGAHVYVEKPFALTADDARALLELAQSRNKLVCAGHQLLCDPAFGTLLARAAELGTPVQADSHFAFRPVGIDPARGSSRALAQLLVDVLPHPLYSLIAVLERLAAGRAIELAWADAGPTDLQAVLRAGTLTGRLSVSLRARPVASSLTLTGTEGSLTCDFMRSIVVGAANSGTEALEKMLNPVVEGAQLMTRNGLSLARRFRSSTSYNGLPELIGAFYRAAATRGVSPVSPEHLLRVAELFEDLVARIDRTAASPSPLVRSRPDHTGPLTVVTGARGFLGSAICRALPRVRGTGRGPRPDDAQVEQWVTADLSAGLPADTLRGADVVVHAAAETAGGYDAHQRNTVDGTRQLLLAMHAAGVSRLVLISSLSVIRPPRTPWERQDEGTPRPEDPRRFGAYTWGKCLQEELVEREAAALGIQTRVIRPGALVDWRDDVLPGIMGRRLFGRWYLGLGRPKLPIAVCDVEHCADAIAWCATNFDDAPPIVNLLDPTIATRGDFAARLRSRGWQGRIFWVPISVIALGLTTARTMLSLARGRWPERLAAWSVLRPRRYHTRLAASMLGVAKQNAPVPQRADVALPV
jgi:predicted dehydrogenase/nucleoside-diphosphate-sugar epimerase